VWNSIKGQNQCGENEVKVKTNNGKKKTIIKKKTCVCVCTEDGNEVKYIFLKEANILSEYFVAYT